MALKALSGVGDAKLGEWFDDREVAYHVRRRLSAEEQELVGAVADIRGTEEARRRVDGLFVSFGTITIPSQVCRFAMEEAGLR